MRGECMFLKIRCDMMWCDMIWYDMVRYDNDMIRHNTIDGYYIEMIWCDR